MGRNRVKDPKIIVTLRLRASLQAAYEADGADWRARMETILERAIAGPGAAKEAVSKPSPTKTKERTKKACTAIPETREPYGYAMDGTPLYR